MTANLSHFAINADDLEASKTFYTEVLGWKFHPWGPPGFFQIETGDEANPGMLGAIQGRRELVEGTKTIGFECTFAVDDVDAVAKAVVANGGRVLMERVTIPTVGDLMFFADPAGNAVGAMQYVTPPG